MSKRSKLHASGSQHSPRPVERKGPALKRRSATGRDISSKKVTPTSERIIKETSVKWRKAMQVLADR